MIYKMKLNTVLRVASLFCIATLGTIALIGCSGTPERAGVTDTVKPIPDMQHLDTKPGESKVMAFKKAFRQSAPGVGQ
jgi:hypothetical protein